MHVVGNCAAHFITRNDDVSIASSVFAAAVGDEQGGVAARRVVGLGVVADDVDVVGEEDEDGEEQDGHEGERQADYGALDDAGPGLKYGYLRILSSVVFGRQSE